MEQVKNSKIRFRPNVAGILQNAEGQILICERLSPPGAWQFPQGGVDKGETVEDALQREMEEEICVRPEHYEVIEKRGPYRYVFADNRKRRGFHGQEQTYFLLRFKGDDSCINVATKHQEFRTTRWIYPNEFELSWLPEFKRDVYRAVLRDFFNVVK